MQAFTDARGAATPDEIWLTEHPPIYTLGTRRPARAPAARQRHSGVKVDRGGQVTYHGPGQLVAYTLFDLRRAEIGRPRHGPAHRGRGDTMA